MIHQHPQSKHTLQYEPGLLLHYDRGFVSFVRGLVGTCSANGANVEFLLK